MQKWWAPEPKDKSDGTTHRLWGVENAPGNAHGHLVTDTETGNIVYFRDEQGYRVAPSGEPLGKEGVDVPK